MIIDSNNLIDLAGQTNTTGVAHNIKGFNEETPGHADYFNLVFKQLIDNDVTLEASTYHAIKNTVLNQIAMAIELETLKGATLTGVTANIFVENFRDTQDINIIQGSFDATSRKVYLK